MKNSNIEQENLNVVELSDADLEAVNGGCGILGGGLLGGGLCGGIGLGVGLCGEGFGDGDGFYHGGCGGFYHGGCGGFYYGGGEGFHGPCY